MSAVKKTAKFSLWLFSIFVVLVVAGAIYVYVNMDSLARQISERVASDAMGVPVTIGGMNIFLEEKKVVVKDVRVANPPGYKKDYAIRIGEIEIAAETLSKELLRFARVNVERTDVNLEVTGKSTNLGDLKKNLESGKSGGAEGEQIKVIVKQFALTQAQLNPSVTLLKKDLAYVKVPDIHLTGIGEKEGGVVAGEAIAQVMNVVLKRFNSAANSAGFLEGLSLDILNNMGVSTGEVFKKNLKENFNEDVQQLKDGFQGIFQRK